jgi:hypothetical protein
MNVPKRQKRSLLDEETQDQEYEAQEALLKAFTGTLYHHFGGWQKLFKGVRDGRKPALISYPMESLLSTGVLMYLFRGSAATDQPSTAWKYAIPNQI